MIPKSCFRLAIDCFLVMHNTRAGMGVIGINCDVGNWFGKTSSDLEHLVCFKGLLPLAGISSSQLAGVYCGHLGVSQSLMQSTASHVESHE